MPQLRYSDGNGGTVLTPLLALIVDSLLTNARHCHDFLCSTASLGPSIALFHMRSATNDRGSSTRMFCCREIISVPSVFGADRPDNPHQFVRLNLRSSVSLTNRFSNLGERIFLQKACITVELADALRQLLGRHRILVMRPAESLLVEMQSLLSARSCFCRV